MKQMKKINQGWKLLSVLPLAGLLAAAMGFAAPAFAGPNPGAPGKGGRYPFYVNLLVPLATSVSWREDKKKASRGERRGRALMVRRRAKNEESGMELKIVEHKSAAASVALILSGVVYAHTAMQLRQHLKPLLDDRHKKIRVDLGSVNFIDSAGIATLVEGLKWSRNDGRRFVLSGLSENVRDFFELSKLDTVFEIDNADL